MGINISKSRIHATYLVLVGALLVSGCAGLGYLSSALISPPGKLQIVDDQIGRMEIYHVDTGDDPAHGIFFVSGSGCASLSYYLRDYFDGLKGSFRIYSLQKAGVGSLSSGQKCSEDFHLNNTAENLIARNIAAIKAAERDFGRPLKAIIGVSEGGIIAAHLASMNPQVSNLVVIGSGGMTFRRELELIAERRGQLEATRQRLAQVPLDPQSISRGFWGMPNRYLASMLDLDPMPIFESAKQPILIIGGGDDVNVPVASMQLLADKLRISGRDNITINLVDGASHTLERNGQDLKPAVMNRLNDWLSGGAWKDVK